MSFRLFGIPVEIQLSFWITGALFGWIGASQERKELLVPLVLAWMLVLFFSILIHELGHALAYKAFKVSSNIVLHGMGGATYGRVLLPLRRTSQILVSLAGPFAGFLFAAAMYGGRTLLPVGYEA